MNAGYPRHIADCRVRNVAQSVRNLRPQFSETTLTHEHKHNHVAFTITLRIGGLPPFQPSFNPFALMLILYCESQFVIISQ